MSHSMGYGVRPIGKGQIYQARVGKRQEALAPHPPNRKESDFLLYMHQRSTS